MEEKDKNLEMSAIKPKEKPLEIYDFEAIKLILKILFLWFCVILFYFIKSYVYDMNGGPEKQRYIVSEVDKVSAMSVNPALNSSKPEQFIGGSRKYTRSLYATANPAIIKDEFERLAIANGWDKKGDIYYKEKMEMTFRILDKTEYYDDKDLKGKTVWTVQISIE